jgi:hypothetical protein
MISGSDFEPQYDEQEHAWTTLRGLGDVLLLNCAQCDGPSDQRHSRCKDCVERREQLAKNSYQKATGQSKQKWSPSFYVEFMHSNIGIYPFVLKRFNIRLMRLY